jgi:hypothetical protein
LLSATDKLTAELQAAEPLTSSVMLQQNDVFRSLCENQSGYEKYFLELIHADCHLMALHIQRHPAMFRVLPSSKCGRVIVLDCPVRLPNCVSVSVEVPEVKTSLQ